MRHRGGILCPEEQVAGLVIFTVYARADLTVGARVLQLAVVRGFTIERFVADLSRFDHRRVRGLEAAAGPVMRISLAVSVQDDREVERLGKYLNRIVDVFKVEQAFTI